MEILGLVVAIICAIAYAGVIAILLWNNPKNAQAWSIALVALIMWPGLFFLNVAQLLFVVPMVTVFSINGRDLSKPLSPKAIYWALATTTALMVIFAVIGLALDS
jgi:hypothetical protein